MAARRDAELTEVADGCLAYVQGRGGWGWSNSGLVETLPNASRWVQQRLDTARRDAPTRRPEGSS